MSQTGIRVAYNTDRAVGQRVQSVYIKCTHCAIPEYEELETDQVYGILMSDFMLYGGDGYDMIYDNMVEHENIG